MLVPCVSSCKSCLKLRWWRCSGYGTRVNRINSSFRNLKDHLRSRRSVDGKNGDFWFSRNEIQKCQTAGKEPKLLILWRCSFNNKRLCFRLQWLLPNKLQSRCFDTTPTSEHHHNWRVLSNQERVRATSYRYRRATKSVVRNYALARERKHTLAVYSSQSEKVARSLSARVNGLYHVQKRQCQ